MARELVLPDADVSKLEEIDTLITTLHRKLTALAATLARRQRFVYGCLDARHEEYCHTALTELAKNPDLIPIEAEIPGLLEVLKAASCLRGSFHMLDDMDKLRLDIQETLGGDLVTAAIEAHVILKAADREHRIPELYQKKAARKVTTARAPIVLQSGTRRH